jgi:hypothetical protein
MSHAEVTYRAVQAVSPGKLELTRPVGWVEPFAKPIDVPKGI